MSDIRFYHLERSSLEQVLPALLGKALQTGERILVKTPNAAMAERLSEHLWTYDPAAFLPHGCDNDGHKEDQPVFLTHTDEIPNGATILFLTGGAQADNLDKYRMVCEIFDGSNPETLSTARVRWKEYKDAGHTLTYWQQGPKGWESKA